MTWWRSPPRDSAFDANDAYDVMTYLDFARMGHWIQRRVEKISYPSVNLGRRSVSVDVDLLARRRTATAAVAANGGQDSTADETVARRERYSSLIERWDGEGHAPGSGLAALVTVPVALVRGRVFSSFDLRDSGGAPIPLLTKNQNQYYSRSLLRGAALLDIGAPIDDDRLAAHIDRVVSYGDHIDHDEPCPECPTVPASPPGPPDAPWARENYTWAAEALLGHFVAVALLPADSAERLVVKYGAELKDSAQLDESTSGRRPAGLGARIRGLWRAERRFDTESDFTQASYHMEVDAPDGATWTHAGFHDVAGQRLRTRSSPGERVYHGIVPDGADELALLLRPGALHVWLPAGVAAVAGAVAFAVDAGDYPARVWSMAVSLEVLWTIAAILLGGSGALFAVTAHQSSRPLTRKVRWPAIVSTVCFGAYVTLLTAAPQHTDVADWLRILTCGTAGLAVALAVPYVLGALWRKVRRRVHRRTAPAPGEIPPAS